jgi:hypothetical protein
VGAGPIKLNASCHGIFSNCRRWPDQSELDGLFSNAGAQMKIKPKTAYVIGCSFLISIGVLLALFFGVRFISICVRLAAEPRNPLLLGALRLDAGLSLVFALTGLVLTVKTTQIAVKDLFYRRARQTPD